MQDFYWSDRSSGSAGYHHCYSVKISSRDNKAAPESAFTTCLLGGEWVLAALWLFNSLQKLSFFSLFLSSQGNFFSIFWDQLHKMKVPVYSKFWFLYLIQHAGNWQPPNEDGRRAQVKVPVPWSQNTFNCQSFLWIRAVKINAEHKFKASFQGDFLDQTTQQFNMKAIYRVQQFLLLKQHFRRETGHWMTIEMFH